MNMKRIVRINDLCFQRKYFHSASLQVMTPKDSEPECFIVIVLFIDHGMKEYGAKNATLDQTVNQFVELLRKLDGTRISDLERAQLLGEKFRELEFHRSVRAKKQAGAKPASPTIVPVHQGSPEQT